MSGDGSYHQKKADLQKNDPYWHAGQCSNDDNVIETHTDTHKGVPRASNPRRVNGQSVPRPHELRHLQTNYLAISVMFHQTTSHSLTRDDDDDGHGVVQKRWAILRP